MINIVFGVWLLYQSIYLYFVLGSPHKDTGLRLLINILVSGLLFFGCPFITKIPVIYTAIRITAFIVNFLILRYLQKIKYYS